MNVYRVAPEVILCLHWYFGDARRSVFAAARKRVSAWLALAGGIGALASLRLVALHPGDAYGGLMHADDFSLFVHAIVLVVAILATLGSIHISTMKTSSAANFIRCCFLPRREWGFWAARAS